MQEIVEDKLFGNVVAWFWVTEFQKRGLPHMHLLVWLAEANRPREPHQIDAIISAELPTAPNETILRRIIERLMVHGPCGEANPTAICCNRDGQCSKRYPKPFSDETVVDMHGRVERYRRRNDGITVVATYGGRSGVLDNRHVVPHRAALLAIRRSH